MEPMQLFLTQIGSFFMINLCLVVIATQFSETKKREMERMRQERARYQSTSTLASMSASETTSCYRQIIRYIAHLWRRSKRRLLRRYRAYRSRRRQQHSLRRLSLHKRRGRRREKRHQPNCPRYVNHNGGAGDRSAITLRVNDAASTPTPPTPSPQQTTVQRTSPEGSVISRFSAPHYQGAIIINIIMMIMYNITTKLKNINRKWIKYKYNAIHNT